MSKNHVIHPIRGLFIIAKKLFYFACVLIACFTVVGYAAGWVKFERHPQQQLTTIEIKEGEVRQDVQQAVEKGKELVEEFGDQGPQS
jgi:hypothetical protein